MIYDEEIYNIKLEDTVEELSQKNQLTFSQKVRDVTTQIPFLIPIIYSVSGFTQPAVDKMTEQKIAWSTSELRKIL